MPRKIQKLRDRAMEIIEDSLHGTNITDLKINGTEASFFASPAKNYIIDGPLTTETFIQQINDNYGEAAQTHGWREIFHLVKGN